MIRIIREDKINSYIFNNNQIRINKFFIFLLISIILLIFFSYDHIIKSCFENNIRKVDEPSIIINNDLKLFKTNIDLDNELSKMKNIKKQIKIFQKRNISYIETLVANYPNLNIGNSLIILNNLINICINIRCKYIIIPKGKLKFLIKKPIINKKYNITILPDFNEYKNNIKNILYISNAFFFKYKKKNNLIYLKIIKDEVLNNVPKYISNPKDLYIHIRSGDIFLNNYNPFYSQPPLCFYKTVIKESNYSKIYILSNGLENPVIEQLLKLYKKIYFKTLSLINTISIIINAYNFVTSISTFSMTLIWLNNNLKNLYIYDMMDFSYLQTINHNLKFVDYTIYKMKPSEKYVKVMYKKWNKTKEQLDLILKDNCTHNLITPLLFD